MADAGSWPPGSGPPSIGEQVNGDVEEDATHQKMQELQEQTLGPVKEDLADWLSKSLGIDISASNFMDVLDNGVYLCKMANLIQGLAEECVRNGTCTETLPDIKLRCKNNAKSGSWFARDNTANFLQWCKAFNFKDESVFESEDLVSHKYEKSVVICLLELARLGHRFGLEPPSLIKMEKEIEKEEEVPETPQKVQKIGPSDTKPLSLDAEVRKVAFKCHCHEHVKRLDEGKYLIFGKVVYIRLLKDRHLMVRVGGGWTTLESWLIKHRAVEVFEFKRRGSTDDVLENSEKHKYLVIKGKYKSS